MSPNQGPEALLEGSNHNLDYQTVSKLDKLIFESSGSTRQIQQTQEHIILTTLSQKIIHRTAHNQGIQHRPSIRTTPHLPPIYKPCHSRKSINRAPFILEKGPKLEGIKREIGDRSCLLAPPRPPSEFYRTTTGPPPKGPTPDVLSDHHQRPDVLLDHHLKARRSAGPSPEAQRSTGPPIEARRSAGPPPEDRQSVGAPPEDRQSVGTPPDARHSAGPPPEARRSAGQPPDAQRSATHTLDARRSAGHPPDARCSARHTLDARHSAGHPPDARRSTGHTPDSRRSTKPPLDVEVLPDYQLTPELPSDARVLSDHQQELKPDPNPGQEQEHQQEANHFLQLEPQQRPNQLEKKSTQPHPWISKNKQTRFTKGCLKLVSESSRGMPPSNRVSSSVLGKLQDGPLTIRPSRLDNYVLRIFDGNNYSSCKLYLLPSFSKINNVYPVSPTLKNISFHLEVAVLGSEVHMGSQHHLDVLLLLRENPCRHSVPKRILAGFLRIRISSHHLLQDLDCR
ncbi:hypothetical protein M5K25_023795 [Dendrobium thyrsiflorum]|uniref:Uncharacterized protein n=1 Tax=Dendrobium thyrsiflorum TaxID=117978 RepID=A0ABD0U0M9_DENTH